MRERRTTSRRGRQIGRDVLGGLLASAAIIGLCEPFFPNDRVSNPGLLYWLANLFTAYYFGWVGGLLNAALMCGFMAAGPRIPGSAFEATLDNEVRIVASLLIFVASVAFVRVSDGIIQRATERAEAEEERRRTAESELRASERMKTLVMESSLDGIATLDSDGCVLLWNHHAESMFGLPAREAIGRRLSDVLIVPSGWPSASESSFRVEAEAVRSDGSRFDAELSVAINRGDGETLTVAFIRDISERKGAEARVQSINATLEQRVRERTAELAAKNEELEGFSYAVSHDMRSPLRSIVANARMVLEDEGDRVTSSGRAKLERLAGAAMQMAMLVDDLLRYARTGNQSVNLKEIDISGIAESVKALTLRDYPDASIEVEPGISARGDEALTALVMGNLLDNACKYVRSGETACVRVGRIAGEEDRTVTWFVADRGIGLDMAHADRLFKPFERLPTEGEYPGTGFGLANVRRCVERMGGEVWLESTPGVGTTFYVRLPEG